MDHTELEDTRGPLSGVVVADFSRVLAGPYCTMLLADLGATVIKIEAPRGDDTRQWLPPSIDGHSTYFLSINRNKRSIALDLKNDDDLRTAYRIVDRADVLVENFKPGGLLRFGLDRSQTAERWPDLIHASITGFGTKGGASLPGYDLLVQALSGFMHVTGDADGNPQRGGFALFDIFTGLHAAVGILAALQERSATGTAQTVEVNLLSSALSAMVNQTVAFTAGGHEPYRMGNEHPSLFPYGPFRAGDGQVVICCGNDDQFATLMTTIGLPELVADQRFASMELRNKHRTPLRAAIEGRLAERGVDAWLEVLSAAGVCCAPILTVGGGVRYAEQLGLDPIWVAADDERYPTVANPITLSRTPATCRTAPPELNADEDYVRRWLDGAAP